MPAVYLAVWGELKWVVVNPLVCYRAVHVCTQAAQLRLPALMDVAALRLIGALALAGPS